jgi:two-component system, sensor histidine kinase and response regulator
VNQAVARGMLDKLGFVVHIVDNGRQAVAASARSRYAAIMLDVQMPVMDGFEAAAAIKADQPVGRPPIIAMTANAMKGDRERCLAAGMDEYVSKPIRLADLARALSSVLPPSIQTRDLVAAVADSSASLSENTDEASAVDTSALAGLRALRRPGQADPVPRLVDLFIRETDARMALLRNAVARRDLRETERLAHAQKGSSGTMGADEMRSIAQRLELTAAAGHVDAIDGLTEQLEAAFGRSRQILEALRAGDAA